LKERESERARVGGSRHQAAIPNIPLSQLPLGDFLDVPNYTTAEGGKKKKELGGGGGGGGGSGRGDENEQ
jgi:hypothetical protein